MLHIMREYDMGHREPVLESRRPGFKPCLREILGKLLKLSFLSGISAEKLLYQKVTDPD